MLLYLCVQFLGMAGSEGVVVRVFACSPELRLRRCPNAKEPRRISSGFLGSQTVVIEIKVNS